MVKLITILKRRKGMSLQEFSQYWYEKHGPLAITMMPGVKRYVQNHPVRLSGAEPSIDGIAEVWFNDLVSWREFNKWFLSDDSKSLREDNEKFIDTSKTVVLIAEERVIKP